jgi:hypothetical protein
MCAENCNGCSDCLEVNCTSDITCFDGEFQNIVVPEGATLNDVLALIEQYINDEVIDQFVFTLTEPNTIGLAAGDYSYQQIVTAIITNLNTVASDITAIEGDITTIEGDITAIEADIVELQANPVYFKYVKEVETTLDGDVTTITKAELDAFGGLPDGNIQGGGAVSFADLTIECWIQGNDPSPSGTWTRGDSSSIASITIDDATGLISVTTTGGSTDVILRIVVIA